MEFNELIKSIYEDTRYRGICFQLTKGKHLCDELWHETILALYDSKKEVIKADVEGYLRVYVMGVINNIWGKRQRVRRINGNTSVLYMYADNEAEWSDYKEHLGSTGSERYLVQKAVNELNKKIRDKEEGAEMLWQVCKTNVWRTSKELGINHMKVKRTTDKILKQLKRKIDE